MGDLEIDNQYDFFKEVRLDENGALLVALDATATANALQGYYALLSNYYFTGGIATEKAIPEGDVDQWCDVELTIDPQGVFDYRPTSMKLAQANGHTGTGATGSPLIFDLEGLTIESFCNFRASMVFTPEEDEGQLETRLLFNRHTGTTPGSDFSIEEVSLNMANGADLDYPTEPTLTFFVGDTIDTNAAGDAGKVRFQVKSTVPGVISMRALTLYINK